MDARSVSLGLVILGMFALLDVIVGGKYLFKVGKFCFRLLIVITIFIIAIIANNNTEFAIYLNSDLRYFVIFISIAIIAVSLYDIIKVIIKSEDLNERRNRRHHHARTTPANY